MKPRTLFLPVMTLLVFVSVTGCAGHETRTEREQKTQAKAEKQNADQQAANREGQPILGSPTVNQGETEVHGTREVVRREQFNEKIPTITVGVRKADLNRMEQKDFVALGLNPDVAKRVVQFRDKRGGEFYSVDELKSVPGMDMSWYRLNHSKLAVRQQAGQAANLDQSRSTVDQLDQDPGSIGGMDEDHQLDQ